MAGNKNSGNRKGKGKSANQLTQAQRNRSSELISSNRSPLDIMLSNMYFFHDHAENLKERIMAMLDEAQSARAEGSEGPDFEKLQQLVKNHLEARMNAQECAKDAAPFVHPRLSAITVKPATTEEVVVIEAQLAAPMPNLEEDRSYREGYTNVTPLRRVMPGK